MSSTASEKGDHLGATLAEETPDKSAGQMIQSNDREVFSESAEVDFRTVSWQWATIIFLKTVFATGVLSIPIAMSNLGAIGGSLSIVGWGLLNTYTAMIQGDFRLNHPNCHSIADMAGEVGGVVAQEVTGFMFILAYVIATGSGIVGASIGLDVLSDHAACTVWWSFLATVVIAAAASVRKFQHLSWLTWVGFISIFTAVFIVAVAVTTRGRPAAAPAVGEFDLGYQALPHPIPTFAAGMAASCTIFASFAGTSAFLPVISEMKKPRDYRKALFLCMTFIIASYLSLSLVIYRWCGTWVASPSLGSAGHTVEMVAYGIGLAGIMVSACLYLHVTAKYCFVRLLRNTTHIQRNTVTHWATWIGLVIGLAAISFILAEAIQIFNYLIALVGSLCFAPLAVSLPGWLWIADHKSWMRGSMTQRLAFGAHIFLILLGLFMLCGGTYGVVDEIINAYSNGSIGRVFGCNNT
ncbi:Amino acid transporter transmembrane [Penicillium vulpinum]|uniref:Amino acid transporter transmembrane domain-containing protein n=1 Tax=Penicillium vulpinum TaxID=29845 RepID=A0A1V6RI59_9EURO|nr:Amino acid transporter transmembrane [Penicillium vulpinum]KAJ5972585.1 Amino acid transporter transmembrane [Penicillium vulpinum]OQE01188.1 hypothetical protein PENVUL_c044G03368 [Penicillium vulpinum]